MSSGVQFRFDEVPVPAGVAGAVNQHEGCHGRGPFSVAWVRELDAVLLVRLLSRGKLIGRVKLTGEADLSKQVLTAVAVAADADADADAVAVEKKEAANTAMPLSHGTVESGAIQDGETMLRSLEVPDEPSLARALELELADQFPPGSRIGFIDPFGHLWLVGDKRQPMSGSLLDASGAFAPRMAAGPTTIRFRTAGCAAR